MSYQESKTIVSLAGGAAVVAAYCIHVFGGNQAGVLDPNDLKFWAITILTFIGIGIAVGIAIQIVFHILMSIGIAVKTTIQNDHVADKEIDKSIEAEMVEDERDKLIELKAMRLGVIACGVGFVAGLGFLALGYSAAVMLNILFFSFSGGGLLEGIAQLVYYRRGVANA